jgi:hypothetical protein
VRGGAVGPSHRPDLSGGARTTRKLRVAESVRNTGTKGRSRSRVRSRSRRHPCTSASRLPGDRPPLPAEGSSGSDRSDPELVPVFVLGGSASAMSGVDGLALVPWVDREPVAAERRPMDGRTCHRGDLRPRVIRVRDFGSRIDLGKRARGIVQVTGEDVARSDLDPTSDPGPRGRRRSFYSCRDPLPG